MTSSLELILKGELINNSRVPNLNFLEGETLADRVSVMTKPYLTHQSKINALSLSAFAANFNRFESIAKLEK